MPILRSLPPSRRAGLARGPLVLLLAAVALGAVFLVPRLLPSEDGGGGERNKVARPAPIEERAEPEITPAADLVAAKPVEPKETLALPDAIDQHHAAMSELLGDNRGSVTGQLLDARTGEPITSPITVRLTGGSEPTDERHWARISPQRFLTPRDGQFRLGAHRKGHYWVRFEVDGYDPKVVELDVPMEKPPRIPLDRGLWIHGLVTDSAGMAVREMQLTLVPDGERNAFEQTTSTDANGLYVFRGVEAGRWRVEVSGLSGVDEIPSSPVLSLSETTPEGVWNTVLPKLTVVELKLDFDRLVMRDPVATLASRKGARLTTRVRGNEAHFPAVPPGYYDLTIGNADGESWFYEWVEVPESDTPVVWSYAVEAPRNNPIASRSDTKLSAEQREFLRERSKKGKGKNKKKAEEGETEPETPQDG